MWIENFQIYKLHLEKAEEQEIKYQTTLPVSWETNMQDKKQQLELDMEQRTGSKLGKVYIVTLLI